jgi:hypothetical protein
MEHPTGFIQINKAVAASPIFLSSTLYSAQLILNAEQETYCSTLHSVTALVGRAAWLRQARLALALRLQLRRRPPSYWRLACAAPRIIRSSPAKPVWVKARNHPPESPHDPIQRLVTRF